MLEIGDRVFVADPNITFAAAGYICAAVDGGMWRVMFDDGATAVFQECVINRTDSNFSLEWGNA